MKYKEAELRAILADSRYQNIGNLPSNFYPYEKDGMKEMYIRPFNVAELRLVSKAAVLKDLSHLIRAVDLVTTCDAGRLSIGDFYYVLMWLRIHSMPKTPYVVEYHCHEPVLRNREDGRLIMNDASFAVPEDEKNWEVIDCSTHNSEVIHMTNIEIVTLDEDNFDGIEQNGIVAYDFPRAHLIQQIAEAQNDPALRLIIGAAQWVSDDVEYEKNGRLVKAITLDDKIAVLEQQTDLQVFDDAAVLNETIVHGIIEQTTLNCRVCLKKTPHHLMIDALSFFR